MTYLDSMEPNDSNPCEPSVAEIRDLADFYNQWPALRSSALNACTCAGLSDSEREVITWLTVLADRVGDHDIEVPSF